MNATFEYEKWINNDSLEPNLRKELEAMNESDIEEAFHTDLAFGTAGMRGIMGPGTNRMNIYTVRKANVGFAKYLLENITDAKERGVVIAYDSRRNSPEFAYESAKVLATYGIKVYVFEGPRPTPELSFAVRHLVCAGGIVITASHNPPVYNGYKIYDETGCQVLPDEGDKVIAGVESVDDVFAIEVELEADLVKAGLIEFIGPIIDGAYLNAVKSIELNSDIDKSNLSIVFSPLHGTAGDLTEELLLSCGYNRLFLVAEQADPDGKFPTVSYPTPEEAEAFTYAISYGKMVEADILLATDPDADRLGVAVKLENGEYKLLSGNQTGALLAYYILSQRKLKGRLPNKGRVFDTVVSSPLAGKIATSYGMESISTLTGFKFIGEQAMLMEGTEYEYVFGYEESYGALINSEIARDKDAIQAVLLICEAAAYYQSQNITLIDILNKIYDEYGYYQEDLVNIDLTGIEGDAKIQKLLNAFRQDPPVEINDIKIKTRFDFQTGLSFENGRESVIDLPKSDVLKYVLEDGSWFVIRPSGTEPKAKIYFGVVTNSDEDSNNRLEQIKKAVLAKVETILN